jgi:hypothetical protein
MINMKKRIINLDEYLNKISYEFIEEECEDLLKDYIKDIKDNNKLILLKEKLFKSILNKNSNN